PGKLLDLGCVAERAVKPFLDERMKIHEGSKAQCTRPGREGNFKSLRSVHATLPAFATPSAFGSPSTLQHRSINLRCRSGGRTPFASPVNLASRSLSDIG